MKAETLPFAHMLIHSRQDIYFCGKLLGHVEAKEKAVDQKGCIRNIIYILPSVQFLLENKIVNHCPLIFRHSFFYSVSECAHHGMGREYDGAKLKGKGKKQLWKINPMEKS